MKARILKYFFCTVVLVGLVGCDEEKSVSVNDLVLSFNSKEKNLCKNPAQKVTVTVEGNHLPLWDNYDDRAQLTTDGIKALTQTNYASVRCSAFAFKVLSLESKGSKYKEKEEIGVVDPQTCEVSITVPGEYEAIRITVESHFSGADWLDGMYANLYQSEADYFFQEETAFDIPCK